MSVSWRGRFLLTRNHHCFFLLLLWNYLDVTNVAMATGRSDSSAISVFCSISNRVNLNLNGCEYVLARRDPSWTSTFRVQWFVEADSPEISTRSRRSGSRRKKSKYGIIQSPSSFLLTNVSDRIDSFDTKRPTGQQQQQQSNVDFTVIDLLPLPLSNILRSDAST